MARWAACPPRGRWAVSAPAVLEGRRDLTGVRLLGAPAGVTLTAPAWLALLPGPGEPGGDDWTMASWMRDGRVVIDTRAMQPGVYRVWLKIDWPPETPVMPAGRVRLR